MAHFRDPAGRLWHVRLTPGVLDAARDCFEIDLRAGAESDPDALAERLARDEYLLFDLTRLACDDQRYVAGLSHDEFLVHVLMKSNTKVFACFLDALAECFPHVPLFRRYADRLIWKNTAPRS